MRFVFDLDDTISVHKNRDFENAQPIEQTIERIKELHADGHGIIIYTARGQNSCRGDLRLIEERNRDQIERWLERYDVPYDGLVFGKPLGDFYVDDKGVSLDDFLERDYNKLDGNSGSEIYRFGNDVVKRCENARQQADWYAEAARIGLCVPIVKSVVLNSVTMEYIEGQSGANRNLTTADIYRLVGQITIFSFAKDGGKRFDVEALIMRAEEHLNSVRAEHRFPKLFDFLRARKETLGQKASFCHGDLSLSNIIYSGEKTYLIDPIVNEKYSTYLLDYAKLRFSMDGGECFLHGGTIEYKKPLETLDAILQEICEKQTVMALEAVYWIRLLKYTKQPEKQRVAISKARELEDAIW